MVAIDTIPLRGGFVRIDGRTFSELAAVPLRIWIAVVITVVRARLDKRRSRLQLLDLTDDQLRDIGITRAQAVFEANMPVWWSRK